MQPTTSTGKTIENRELPSSQNGAPPTKTIASDPTSKAAPAVEVRGTSFLPGADDKFGIAEGRAVKRRKRRTRHKTKAAAPTPVHKPLWQRIFHRYTAGYVGGLLVLDALALGVFLVDVARFVIRGKTLGAAGRVAGDAVSQGEIITSVASVLVFFLIAVPFVASILPQYLVRSAPAPSRKRAQASRRTAKQTGHLKPGQDRAPSPPRWRRLLLARGWPVVMSHVGIALFIPFFTVLAYTMQILCGFQNHDAANSFESYWMVVVGRINWLSSVIFIPTLLKYVVRFFGHEGPHLGKVFEEVGTEFRMEAGH